MHLARLSLTDFRSYQRLDLSVGPGAIVLTGENGAGKTNLLEAVSLLAPGRGLRQASLGDMARRDGKGGFAVAARLGDETLVGTGIEPEAPGRRRLVINGVPAAVNQLSERLALLWLTPAMDRLFSDSASGRRRFLDRLTLALFPGHAGHAARYEAAMRARNKLLSEPGSADAAWLGALEARMEEHGCALGEARRATVAALAQALRALAPGPFPRPALALEGDGTADLSARLAAGRARDAAAGRALIGPHRADLEVAHEKGEPAASCSTGEQKAILIALILAHAGLVEERCGSPPILLLDEIAAHLDAVRRTALFERLGTRPGQVWMTGTEAAAFAGIGSGASWLEVRGGCVREA